VKHGFGRGSSIFAGRVDQKQRNPSKILQEEFARDFIFPMIQTWPLVIMLLDSVATKCRVI
jgi:hypothetical protein